MCSHIINIFSKEGENPPLDKGNLYLSGVNVLGKPDLMKNKQIGCVLTIIDKWTYNHYKV